MPFRECDATAVRESIEADIEEHVGCLQRAIRLPSLRVDGVGLREMAELSVELLEETGVSAADLPSPSKTTNSSRVRIVDMK